FQDQFELQPLRSPVLTYYVLGALLACVVPIASAMKIATAAMLSLLPIGLAVYCRGLKKDPSMGVAAACVAWGTLAHWGFISFLGAVGLTLMGLGITLMTVERPTRGRIVALGLVTLAVFLTHPSRLPPYLIAVGLTTAAMFPVHRCLRPVAIAVAPAVVLFAAWWLARPATETGAVTLQFDPGRASLMGQWLLHSFRGPAEAPVLDEVVGLVLGVGVYSGLVRLFHARRRRLPRLSRRALHASAAALAVSLTFLGLYFVLPLRIAAWSLVYPREITVAALCALAALPGLPRSPWLRAPALCALLVAVMAPTRLVTEKHAAFDRWTRGFDDLVAEMPLAPKLGYLLLDRTGPEGDTLPLLHFPAWVQAERGGWLSYHFASNEAAPIRFRRTPPMDVPPATPEGFEWHPEMFDLSTRGKYFDWILVRAPSSPAARLAEDPSLELVDRRGWWWLYHRAPTPAISAP
ncbi:MAG: hypothetical protein ACRENE_18070, partial [Polyangiaceae bacterium]